MSDPKDAPAYETDPTNDYRVTAPPPCVGCGKPAHGSVGGYILCLEAHLLTARRAAQELLAEISRLEMARRK